MGDEQIPGLFKNFPNSCCYRQRLINQPFTLSHGPPSCHVQQFSIAPIEGKHNNNPAKKIALTLNYLRQTSIKKAKRLA